MKKSARVKHKQDCPVGLNVLKVIASFLYQEQVLDFWTLQLTPPALLVCHVRESSAGFALLVWDITG